MCQDQTNKQRLKLYNTGPSLKFASIERSESVSGLDLDGRAPALQAQWYDPGARSARIYEHHVPPPAG